MRSLAKEELPALQAKLGSLNERLKVLLLPRDACLAPRSRGEKSIVLAIDGRELRAQREPVASDRDRERERREAEQ